MALSWKDKKRGTALKIPQDEIQRRLDAIAAQKGIDAEKFVEKAINLLWSQGWVQWYHRARRWGEIDLLGMDFMLRFTTHPAARFPLQVKSSETGKEKHIAQYGDSIPCVVWYPLDTIEIMAGKILMAIFPEFYEERTLTS